VTNPTDDNTDATSPWKRWWVVTQVVVIFGLCAFFILPCNGDPSPEAGPATSPVTGDSSVRR
jgi:hypothetical protein